MKTTALVITSQLKKNQSFKVFIVDCTFLFCYSILEKQMRSMFKGNNKDTRITMLSIYMWSNSIS